MSVSKKIFWVVFALVGAIAFGIATQLINVSEKVNAVWILIAAICIYVIAYRFYSAFLAAKVLVLNDKNETPATLFHDGHDYDPTNKWVLFGHHFAAIAGAGPLIGPVLAAQFGYLPGMLWILIGSVMAGSVHDFIILVFSTRRNGKSLAEIAKAEVGPVTGFTAMLATYFILIVALAGLGMVVVKALAHSAWGTFTIGATIPIAILMGFYLRKFRPGKIKEVSVIGVILLILAVVVGKTFQDTPMLAHMLTFDEKTITLLLVAYGFLASILPVWMLLAPRDYLSTYMKIGTIALLVLGILFLQPNIVFPAVTRFANGGGPIIPGPIFPYLFITIACGAISGFHALISTGTTPKMLVVESDTRMIGYGAMLMEGFISLMALIAATSLAPGDYFLINSQLPDTVLAGMGFTPDKIRWFEAHIGISLEHRTGGAVTLAVGMSNILCAIPGMDRLIAYWYNFALMFEALFILTTIDAGTRVARFIVQEFLGYFYKPMKEYNWTPGMLISSLFVVFCWGYLIWTGSISTIWPMFGISNQLLSGLALTIATTILIKMKKFKYIWVTLIPMIAMIVITLTTSVMQVQYYQNELNKSNITSLEAFTLNLDTILVIIMASLAVIIVVDNVLKWKRFANEPYIEPVSGGDKSKVPTVALSD
jgi:carbon starvation protein